jgi:hypothetical protein
MLALLWQLTGTELPFWLPSGALLVLVLWWTRYLAVKYAKRSQVIYAVGALLSVAVIVSAITNR